MELPTNELDSSKTNQSSDNKLPTHVQYWLSSDAKHDCYFQLVSESGAFERIGAFKAFLIGFSEPFRCMLTDSPLAESGDIEIIDTKPEIFKNLLKCLYMGYGCMKVIKSLCFPACIELLALSDKYLVTYIKDKIVNHLLRTFPLNNENIFHALCNPIFWNEDQLEVLLKDTIQSNVSFVLNSHSFYDIPSKSLLWILKLDPLCDNELDVWNAVLRWAKHKTNSNEAPVIRQCLIQHLKFIRFCTMNIKDFCEKVVTTGILTPVEVNNICKSFGTLMEPNLEFISNSIIPRTKTTVEPNEITFAFCKTNARQFSGDDKSCKFLFKSCLWAISIENDENDFGVYLICEFPKGNSLKECTVTVKFTLLSPNTNVLPDLYNESTFIFNTNVKEHYTYFCSWETVVQRSKTYIQDDRLIILVSLK